MIKHKIIAVLSFFICSIGPIMAQKTLSQRTNDRFYRTGLELMDKKKYGAAADAFKKYIATESQTENAVNAQYYIAFAALNLYNPDAPTLIEDFVTQHPEHPKASSAYLDLGNFYFQQKKYEHALVYYTKAKNERLGTEQQAEADYKLGYALLSQKEFDKAEAQFNKVKDSQHKYTGAANYYSAYLNIRKGRYADATKELDKAEKDEAFKSMVPVMRMNIFLRQKEYDKAIELGEKSLADGKEGNEDLAALLADAYYIKGNYAKAAKNYDTYLKGKPTLNPALQYRIGYSQLQTDQLSSAIENFKTVAAKPDTAANKKDTIAQAAAYYLGVAYLKANNKTFAIGPFDQARRSQADKQIQEWAWFQYGKLNYDLGKYTDAISILQAYIKTFPSADNITEANDLLGEAYLNSNNYDEALSHINKLQKRSPRIDAAHQRVAFMKGVQLFNDSRYQDAAQLFETSLKYPIDNEVTIAANYWAGETYSIGKQYPEAINKYAAVFKLPKANASDYNLKTRYGIGYAYYNNKEYDKALIHFKAYVNQLEVTDHKLNYADALVRLADCYYTTKDYTTALSTYDKAIAQNNPDADYCYYQKGIIHALNNRSNDANTNFQIVLSNYPRSNYRDEAKFQMAQLDFEKGNYQTAIDKYTQLIKGNTSRDVLPYAYMRRALAYSNIKQYEKSVEDYKTILNEFPAHKTSNSALLGLQEALGNAGNIEEFNDYLTKFKKANPDNESLESIEFETAKGLYFSQKYAKAIKNLEEYINTYPNNNFSMDARYFLGESYYRTNDKTNAAKYHKEVLNDGKSANVSKSVARLAELQFEAREYQQAISYYHLLLNMAKNKKEQFNAWTGLVEGYYYLNKYDSSSYYAHEIINKGNAYIDAQNKATLYLGKIAYAQGDNEKATDEFINTLNNAKDQNGAEAQYLMAEILYKERKYKESIETLYNLNKNFAHYQKWYDKSFLLIADNFIALNELYQARATLNTIIEKSPDKDTRETAKNKLVTIKDKK